MRVPSPSFPACSAAPPCSILVRTFSPSAGAWPAAALPIPPGLLPIPTGAALEPANNNNKKSKSSCTVCHIFACGGGYDILTVIL